MTDPDNTQEEPQEARGAPGSRDEGGPPGAGPADRPAGTSGHDDDTGVDAQGSADPDTPQMPAGDQGG